MNELKRVPQLFSSHEKKKKKTYQVRPNGLVKETLAIIETYNFVIVWSNCLTCLIFSHMKCFYHKKK
jgi:hypothetical protein